MITKDAGMLKGLSSSWSSESKIDFFLWFHNTLEFFKSKDNVAWWCKPPKITLGISLMGRYGKIPYRMTVFGDILTTENIVKLEALYMPNGV